MRYRLALVDYLNTLPFSLGLQLKGLDKAMEIYKVTPARCAELFRTGQVDISLCPVGALQDMPAYSIRGSYCIGANGPVDTVMLLSTVPLHDIRRIRLDDHSRTSNKLLNLLAERHWKKEWDLYHDADESFPESCLMIGDKVFTNREFYPYQFDLAQAWKELTRLPMVFAVWIARPEVPEEFIAQLDEAFREGLDAVATHDLGLASWEKEYLLHRISYPLDEEKVKAMELYLEWTPAQTAETILR